MLELDLMDETNSIPEETLALVGKVLQSAGEQLSVKEGSEVSVTFVTNEAIQEINKTYRNKDMATDVISFAMEEMEEGEVEIINADIPTLLGDIIISVQRATEQAETYQHSFERELCFLAVHGFLHLLGYDHGTEQQEKEMFGLQESILQAFGLKREGHEPS
ncbi:probable rRNA maturation factor [Psychrobacillus psychrotolerans]|uniref:Endoribonuclease YbeY n=1 Tax=Psychrobacillus psychrotolerans TaxID=126156 RepID=A0A1I6B4T3_9BACI|nr:rRNA maturation RNase YbeY [Psychrobacillus psychrotolerans]SFQ75941.1 probable rRNA maturation factor [Psychrobacillus psychrotolerans]